MSPLAALGDTGFSERAIAGPRKRPRRNAGNEWSALPKARWLPPGATPSFTKSRVLPGGGRLVGVMCRTCLLLRADFFAFRFVSNFRRRQPIATVQEIFTDGSSETKWPSPPKRNALPKRAGKPPEGSRRNLRDTGGEKIVRRSGMASGKKNLRATGRAPVLPAVRRCCMEAD